MNTLVTEGKHSLLSKINYKGEGDTFHDRKKRINGILTILTKQKCTGIVWYELYESS